MRQACRAAIGMRRYAAPSALCSRACALRAYARFSLFFPASPRFPRFQPHSVPFPFPPKPDAKHAIGVKTLFLIFYLTCAALPAKSRLVPDELECSKGNTECGTLAQLVEQQTFNLFVDSSTLSCLTCVLVV